MTQYEQVPVESIPAAYMDHVGGDVDSSSYTPAEKAVIIINDLKHSRVIKDLPNFDNGFVAKTMASFKTSAVEMLNSAGIKPLFLSLNKDMTRQEAIDFMANFPTDEIPLRAIPVTDLRNITQEQLVALMKGDAKVKSSPNDKAGAQYRIIFDNNKLMKLLINNNIDADKLLNPPAPPTLTKAAVMTYVNTVYDELKTPPDIARAKFIAVEFKEKLLEIAKAVAKKEGAVIEDFTFTDPSAKRLPKEYSDLMRGIIRCDLCIANCDEALKAPSTEAIGEIVENLKASGKYLLAQVEANEQAASRPKTPDRP